ncbi:MAG TPA: alpha/beta hydrolase-fold protein [Clostridia bacterium]|nr:alpha/beta hydrolase-fold protein [Clostridia bacterium]
MSTTQNHMATSLSKGRLHSRPASPEEQGEVGLHTLEIPDSRRPSLVYVPQSYSPQKPIPVALMFHGAGGSPHDGLALLQNEAEKSGLLLIAPGSREATWDVIAGGYGPDARCIDSALKHVFSHYTVDPDHMAIGGFSDGASYALSLGITNGQLFSHIIAFSPGFMSPTQQPDSPRIFISHGTQDPVLPIEACSRRLVPALEQAGYDVHYHEFSGEHTIRPDIRTEAVNWFLRA